MLKGISIILIIASALILLTGCGKEKEETSKTTPNENVNVNENEIYMTSEEVKGGLFKSLSYKLKIIKKEDVINFIEEYLKNLLKDMGIDVTFESKIREEQIIIKMYSDKNELIELPKQFTELERQMNQVRLQNYTNAQEAKEANQRKNDMIMYMAHDLKTPLTSIINYVELIKKEDNITISIK